TYSILTRYDGRTWSTSTISMQGGLLRDGADPIPDGHGGIWLLGSTDVNGDDSALVHCSATGRWTRVPTRPATEFLHLAGHGSRLFALADGKILSNRGTQPVGAVRSVRALLARALSGRR